MKVDNNQGYLSAVMRVSALRVSYSLPVTDSKHLHSVT